MCPRILCNVVIAENLFFEQGNYIAYLTWLTKSSKEL